MSSRLSYNTAHIAWTAALVAGLPLFAWQAHRLRRDTPRLPEAQGPCEGRIAGDEPALKLAAIGESTVAGVGVANHEHALVGRCAQALAQRTGRAVDWVACGSNGATARDTRYKQVPRVPADTDIVVIAVGVNDVLSGCTPETWYQNLTKLLASTHRRARRAVIVLSAVPPMGHFPAIAQPLRGLLGLRAGGFDRISSMVAASCPRAVYLPIPFEGGAEYFCDDRFHPSPLGYERWGALVGKAAAVRLAEREASRSGASSARS